jgi:hypothetical protein
MVLAFTLGLQDVIPEVIADGIDAAVPRVLAGLAVFAVLGVVLRLARSSARRKRAVAASLRKVVLLVTVPKESSEKGDEGLKEKSLQQIQEDVAVMEAVFASIGGLSAQKGFGAWWFGRDDEFAFEMVANDGLVSFYVVLPEEQRQFVEQQIHAQYPTAQVEDADDYNFFRHDGACAGVEVSLSRQSFFPLRTYKKMEADPLGPLTSALAKVDKADGAAIQVIVRSAPKSWRGYGLEVAQEMKGGLRLKDAMRKASKGGVAKLASKLSEDVHVVTGGNDPSKPKAEKHEYKLTALDEEMVKGIEEKASKLGLEVTVRVVASAATEGAARAYVDNIANGFSQYAIPQFGNGFAKKKLRPKRVATDFIRRQFADKRHDVLSGEELASIWHLPLSSTETPNIRWLLARKAPPPSNLPKEGITLGHIVYRGQDTPVRVKDADRRRHMYVIGKSGSGKTEMMKAMVKQDIEAGKGVCVIDPHGDFADDCLAFVPRERAEDVIYFAPGDIERPMGLNLLEYDPAYPEQKTFVINEMLKIFDKLYDLKSTGGPMFEQYMRNAMILVMDHPESGATLMEIPRVLSDEEFRKMKLKHCKTQVVKDFWEKEAQKAGGEASLANMVPYITSKLTPFISNDIMRPIIGQQKSAFNVREVMDGGKILLLNLSKGKLGDLNAYLIGMVLVGKILMSALSRTDMDKDKRRDFYLYIDEFQNFITDSISIILSEARKYGLNLTLAHQFIGQLTKDNDTSIRDAVFGNVGSMAAFRVGTDDAEFLVKEFSPTFSQFDLVNVEAYTANAKILIDNTASRPFNMSMYPPAKGSTALVDPIRQLSRLKYGRDRAVVEEEIRERQQGAAPGEEAPSMEW